MFDYFLIFGLIFCLGLGLASPALFIYMCWRGLRMVFRKRIGINYANL